MSTKRVDTTAASHGLTSLDNPNPPRENAALMSAARENFDQEQMRRLRVAGLNPAMSMDEHAALALDQLRCALRSGKPMQTRSGKPGVCPESPRQLAAQYLRCAKDESWQPEKEFLREALQAYSEWLHARIQARLEELILDVYVFGDSASRRRWLRVFRQLGCEPLPGELQ